MPHTRHEAASDKTLALAKTAECYTWIAFQKLKEEEKVINVDVWEGENVSQWQAEQMKNAPLLTAKWILFLIFNNLLSLLIKTWNLKRPAHPSHICWWDLRDGVAVLLLRLCRLYLSSASELLLIRITLVLPKQGKQSSTTITKQAARVFKNQVSFLNFCFDEHSWFRFQSR